MIRPCFLAAAVSTPALFFTSCGPPAAASAAQEAHEHDPTSTTVFGERLLLFMEYPHLVRGAPARFLAHFTVLSTGEPVRTGSVTLEIGDTRFTVDAPKREGLFMPEGSPPEAGTFAGRLIVKSEQAEETLELGELVVHPDHEAADHAAHAEEGDEPPNAVPFLMEPQWKVKLLVAEAQTRTLNQRLLVPARAAAPEGRSLVVSPSVGGRLVAAPSGSFPRTGRRVEAGEVLALVEPPLSASDLAQLHALDMELDLRALDVLRAAAEADAGLDFARREKERIGKLRAEGLGTQERLEQAEEDLAMAQVKIEAAGRMQESVDRLLERRRISAGSDASAPLRFALDAPIAGEVVEVLCAPGSSVEAGQPVVRLLDSARIWVEGRVSEFDLALVGGARGAVAQFTALPGRPFELQDASDGRLYIGPEVDPASRTLLVRYELENSDGAVRPGMLAELQISTGEREVRVAIPIDAVVMDQGLATAYVMLEGELFQKRDLELGMKDGAWVEVVRGVEPGERVATRGAYIIKLAALSPTSFGAGHAH